jgi:prephenate dehydrogenase
MHQAAVIIGIGEMGGVFAGGFLSWSLKTSLF